MPDKIQPNFFRLRIRRAVAKAVVDKIEAVAVNENSHPKEDVIIESIELTNSADTYELTDEEKADLNSGIGPELPDEIESDDNKNDKNDGSDENADEEE